MSYILDALKKSEQERQLGNVPSVNTEQTTKSKGLTLALWGFAVVVVINILAIAWYQVLKKPERNDPVVLQVPAVQHATPFASVMPATESSPPKIEPQDSPFSQLVASSPQSVTPKVTVADKPLEVQPTVKPAPVNASSEKQSVVDAQPTPGVREQNGGQQDLPLLEQMPVNVQSSSLPLNVDVHVFDSKPAKRFVFINGKRYKEGQEVKPGLQLKEIERNSLVLTFDGLIFRFMVHN